MSQERFNKGMNELKKKYDEAPTTTPLNLIVDAVQKDQNDKSRGRVRRRRRSIYWPPLAAALAVIVIASILFQSILSSDGQLGADDMNGNQSAQDSPLTPGTEGNDNENSLDGNEDINKDKEDLPSFFVDRQETITHTEWPEGMPEEVTYDLFISQSLRFSTYVSRAFNANLLESENKVSFSKEFIKLELVMLPPEMASTPQDELINQIKEKLFDRGFGEFRESDEDMFENIPHQGFMLDYKEELVTYYALLENKHTGALYSFSAEMPIFAQEGTFYPGIKRFVNDIEFY